LFRVFGKNPPQFVDDFTTSKKSRSPAVAVNDKRNAANVRPFDGFKNNRVFFSVLPRSFPTSLKISR
jgi:hypothetical protein